MRNLKKALALVMAFALVFATVASAASFTDVPSSYSYSEEVELLADLGILVGVDGSTFQPDATLTRVQAAAVIFRCLTGRTSADMYAGATKFWDVAATYWGTGYINFCSNAGAIGGYPDGSFKPDQPVTVAEFESMLVRALGLTEGKTLTYPNGYLAIADANLINDEVSSVSANAPANRGLVAKLAYNAICNATYQTIATSDKPSPKIIEEIFKITPTNAIIVGAGKYFLDGTANVTAPGAAVGATPSGAAPGTDKIEYAYANSTGTATLFATATSSKSGKDLLGLKVKVYKKTTDSKVYAVVPSSDNVVVTKTNQEIYKTSTPQYFYKKADGTKQYFTVPAAGTSKIYRNMAYLAASAFDSGTPANDVFINGGTSTSGTAGIKTLRTITLVSNDGTASTIEYVFSTEYEIGQYDGTYSDKLYFKAISGTSTAAPAAIDLKDSNDTAKNVVYPSGLAKDDKVMIYRDAISTVPYAEVTPLTSATGELSKITDGSTYTIGGTDYKYGVTAANAAYSTVSSYGASDIGKSIDILVAPTFGVMVKSAETTATIPNYFYITGWKVNTDTYTGSITYNVQGYKTDATKVEYKLDDYVTNLSSVTTLSAAAGATANDVVIGNFNTTTGVYTPVGGFATTVAPVADANLIAIYGQFFNTLQVTADTTNLSTALTDVKFSAAKNTAALKTVFTITTNSSSQITKAVLPGTAVAALSTALNKDTYNSTSNLFDSSMKVDSSSVFYFDKNNDGETVKVYIGTFPAVTAASNSWLGGFKDASKAPAVVETAVIRGEAKGTASSLSNIYGVLTSGYNLISAGTDSYYIEVTMLTQGAKKTLRTVAMDKDDANAIIGVYKKNTLMVYDLTSDGQIALDATTANTFDYQTLTTALPFSDVLDASFSGADAAYATDLIAVCGDYVVTAGGVSSISDSLIGIAQNAAVSAGGDNVRYYTVASDVKVYELDSATASNGTAASIGAVRTVPTGTTRKTAILVFDADATADIGTAEVTEIYYVK